ncbi:dihydrofolate reductase family protein, partial [Pseudescherichia sp.]|uniref:dihydrofolate reductase family protein n=1 Tax=Pseudescherichia sp. TaxID=2055881 RepID=UPI0028A8418A
LEGLSAHYDVHSTDMVGHDPRYPVGDGWSGLVDELIVYLAPKLLGSEARGLCVLPGLESLAAAPQLKFTEIRQVGPDLCLHLIPA